jgi:hypothetical protein
VLARQGRRPVYLVWAAFLTVVGVGYFVGSLHALITLVVITDVVLLALLLALSLYTPPRDDQAEEPAA